jgi:hypothetical protein
VQPKREVDNTIVSQGCLPALASTMRVGLIGLSLGVAGSAVMITDVTARIVTDP